MFVREQLHLPVPVAVVRERLLTQLQTDGLYAASSVALNRGPSTIRGDGDRGSGDGKVAFKSRHLTVHTLTPYARGPVTVLPVRWFTDGAGDGQPSLDANLEFGPSETDATTQLLLVGVFRPMPPRQPDRSRRATANFPQHCPTLPHQGRSTGGARPTHERGRRPLVVQ